ncbi:LysR family transcriptional regulator [Arsenicitalea aurantiaca]|uniref:LysR family transcriptional regulator n=1 Tax=Arsenicitalea aurantiaca TaxID=1783274 RepID=A0A433XL67_9HYPH|nr:LysR family transcriptional regulator [Arsenicitalea aurantiaca]RUT34801.1 LysR family transcriptional regulator [Arsenicitalea aurantiaca]
MMKLQQLRYLIQVAESGSFTKAATKLNIAQPALSKQIRLLESDLGVALFVRDGRGVEATAAGRELLRRAGLLFHDLYEMRQAVTSYRDVVEGTVTIGMMPMLGAHVVPDLLLRARQLHPNVRINFMVGMSDAIHEWVIAGRVDFGIVSTAAETSKYLVYQPLATSRMELVHSVSDAAVNEGNAMTLAEALQLPLVIPTKANGLRSLIERGAAEKGLSLQPVIEVDSIDIIKRLVRTGIGGAILPRFSILEELERGDFRSDPIVEPELTYEAAITFPVERPLSSISSAIASILQEVVISVLSEAPSVSNDYS